jgi:hypothetical protein
MQLNAHFAPPGCSNDSRWQLDAGPCGRVLVVEEEPTIAEVSRYLERAGYTTHHEHGGPQAVAAAAPPGAPI